MNDKESIKKALKLWLSKQDDPNSIMMASSFGSFTPIQLIEEIEKESETGKELVLNIIRLTIDLLFRNKEKI